MSIIKKLKKQILKESDELKYSFNKNEWDNVIETNKKKLLMVFLAGSLVATLIWLLVFYIYLQTNFVRVW